MIKQVKENCADRKKVHQLVHQMEWHLQKIKDLDYCISYLDLKDLQDAEDLMDNITPYFGRKV